MYGLMVDFEPTRATMVSRGRNKGLNSGNVAVKSETAEDMDHVSGGGIGIKLEC